MYTQTKIHPHPNHTKKENKRENRIEIHEKPKIWSDQVVNLPFSWYP